MDEPPSPSTRAAPLAMSVAVARRFLVAHHMLAPPRALPAAEDSVLRVLDRLGSLQFDPLSIAGRNHDLVLAARIAGYRPEWTERLLYGRRALFEAYNKGLSILPTAELPWYRITWDRARARHGAETFRTHRAAAEQLLERIRGAGPASSLDFEHGGDIDWYWRPTNRSRALLEALAEAGVLGLARRAGNRRYYDLAERLFPTELLERRPPAAEQLAHKLLSRYRAHGLLGAGGQAELWYGTGPAVTRDGAGSLPSRAALRRELVERGRLLEVQVEGLRGTRYVLAEERPLLEQAEREVAAGTPPGGCTPEATFLAPLDPFVWDRDLLRRLYGFDYVWEVYVPAERRRWGYYVLPILYGDRLVGRIEPRFERAAGRVRVLGLWWEAGVRPRAEEGLVGAMRRALAAYLDFGACGEIEWAPGLEAAGRLFTPRRRHATSAAASPAAARRRAGRARP